MSARYFDRVDQPPPPLTATEAGLVLEWGRGSPHPARGPNMFTTLLAAELEAEATDDYTFFVEADDGARLWIGGELVVDWMRHPTRGPMAANKRLEAGVRYPLFVEHFESIDDARISVTWKRPSTVKAEIPRCQLRPASGEPPRCDRPPLADCVPDGTPPCGQGQGLTATYYRDQDFRQLVATEMNAELYYVWFFLSDPSVVTDPYWVRWEGYLEPPTTDTYTFYVVSDRYTRLYLEGHEGGQDNDEGTYHEGTVTLPLEGGRRYPLRIEAHDATPAHAPMLQVRWSAPSVPKGAIPRCRFFSPTPRDGGAGG